MDTSRAVARKKLQPRRTHGLLYEISCMKSFNIISLIKKIKNRQYLINFTKASASVRLILATAVTRVSIGCYKPVKINPLGPKSDQHQFSPNIISRSSRVKVMRITKLITKGRML